MTSPNTPKRLKLSVIMPAYNEEAVIGATVTELSRELEACGIDYEIIAVDDASTDGTATVLAGLAAENDRLRPVHNAGPNGYGFAIRKGLEIYSGDAAVVVTSDGSDAPKDVVGYVRLIEAGNDCAFGQRFVAGSRVEGYPVFKRRVNRIANWLLGRLTGSSYRDFTNGFKCYRREVIEAMQPLEAGQFNITIEMSLKAVLGGFSFGVIPTDWRQRDAGQSTFRLFRLVKPYLVTLIYCFAQRSLRATRR